IEKTRPRIAETRIFLKVKAPYGPLASRQSIANIVVSALKRAGLEEVRPQGAHLFRHSTATAMLRSGQSMETISALLRHKSMETTAIYAKTNTSMLLEIAQPWIGDPS
ncbi:MAG: tyrosine-type recombinase/integrase, partial [Gemmatimonadota bacterium]|nr:tyrosine-type recombinase/integrase [Gemmatimonadota bacterium]